MAFKIIVRGYNNAIVIISHLQDMDTTAISFVGVKSIQYSYKSLILKIRVQVMMIMIMIIIICYSRGELNSEGTIIIIIILDLRHAKS